MPTSEDIAMRCVAHRLASIGGELRTDYDGTLYVSVPTGYMEAVEIERDGGTFYVTGRQWDRTGGLSSETVIGEFRRWDSAAKAARDTYYAELRHAAELAEAWA